LSKLAALGPIELFNELDPSGMFASAAFVGRAVLEFRGRVALDEETLKPLPDLE
jgi:hypothetical protein